MLGQYAARLDGVPAVRIARPNAEQFLNLLRENSASIPAARRMRVTADLLLAQGDRVKSLAICRSAAQNIAKTADQGWDQGLVPRGEYFVDTSARNPHTAGGLFLPFTIGPGSHRDNWLIRRFIAMDAWAEARREFERVWQLHSEATQPYVIRRQNYDDRFQPRGENRYIVTPDGYGLRFTLDFAYFLQRQDDSAAAEDVLMTVLLKIDMDRNPRHVSYGAPVAETAGSNLPERTIHREFCRASVSRQEFIRLAFDAFRMHGHEAAAVQRLTDEIAAGENRLRRVLAQIRSHSRGSLRRL